MRGKSNEKGKNWLLIEAHDEWERGPKDPDILKQSPRSVLSGHSMEEIAEGNDRKRVLRLHRSVKQNVRAEGDAG